MKYFEKYSFTFMALIAIGLGLYSNYWIITERNFFVFDDYAWLYQAQFTNFYDLINVLPKMAYNDRPAGAVFIKLLYLLFGFDSQNHHAVLLMLHLFNTILVFAVIRYALDYLKLISYFWEKLLTSFLGSVIFAIWPKSVMSVQWDAAIFDLLGTNLALITIFIYLRNKLSNDYPLFDKCLLIVMFFIALRTKEMFVVIPFIFIMLEVVFNQQNKIKFYRLSLETKVMTAMSILYFLMIMALRKGNNIVLEPSSPYYMDFNILSIIKNFIKYMFLYFNLTGAEFSFSGFKWTGVILAGLCLILMLVSVLLIVRNKKLIWGILPASILISLGPVLPMKNMQHNLYLYFPSVFIACFISVVFYLLLRKMLSKSGAWLIVYLLVALLLTLGVNSLQGVKDNRNYWMAVSIDNKNSFIDLQGLSKPDPDTTIYVEGITNSHHVFGYGPGFVNNIIFNDPTIKTSLDTSQIDKTRKYILLQYMSDGHLIEIERN